MSKLKVGDKVRIAKSSEYYGDNDIYNPIHVDGKVIEVRNRLHSPCEIEVDWDNGMYNTYRESDLELVSESKPEFKVGDRVRILDSNGSDLEIGSEHIVDKVLAPCYEVAIFHFDDKHLELVEQKPQFKVGHGAICIKETHKHNVGDVLLVTDISTSGLRLENTGPYFLKANFTPCPNPPRTHYKERIAYALGADIEWAYHDSAWCKEGNPEFSEDCKYRVSIPDPNAEKLKQLQAEIERLQSELDNLGGDL